MKPIRCCVVARAALLILSVFAPAQSPLPQYPPPAEVRAAFRKLLDRPVVPADPKPVGRRVQGNGQTIEDLTIATETRADGTPERVPIRVVTPAGAGASRRPTIIVLHGTGGSKDSVKDWLTAFADHGFLAIAIDARYHGDRAGGQRGKAAYEAAALRAWRGKPGEPQEHPWFYDTCWDLWRTVDYLRIRPDVDPDRIGMIGISMGGIQTWLAAAVDERVKVAIPAIAVQSFRWSLEHDRWQGRARTIQAVHDAVAKDLGESAVNAMVCRELWAKIVPGITEQFDCPSMLRLFAGRPLLILNGDRDPNCPIDGARLAIASAEVAFREANATDKLRVMIAEGVGHQVTPEQRAAAIAWCEKWLK
ncbi:MAG TPA: alpha/beta fold hydrolase [Gemmataceae bacterium]|nr:alpha/beta fold hydrolase [Gemmataceae bacterium]